MDLVLQPYAGLWRAQSPISPPCHDDVCSVASQASLLLLKKWTILITRGCVVLVVVDAVEEGTRHVGVGGR